MVATWTRSFPMPTKLTHYTLLNPEGVTAWKTDGPTQGRCVWDYHDVWRWSKTGDKAVVLRENYFRHRPESGEEVSQVRYEKDLIAYSSIQINFYADFYYPFVSKWSERVRGLSSPGKIVFLEVIPNEVGSLSFSFFPYPDRLLKFCPPSWTKESRPENMVFAPHWYDLRALFSRAFGDFSVNVQGLSRVFEE